MRTFTVDDDLVDLVWRLAKPEPFEQLSFSGALRRVLMGDGGGNTRPAWAVEMESRSAALQKQFRVPVPPSFTVPSASPQASVLGLTVASDKPAWATEIESRNTALQEQFRASFTPRNRAPKADLQELARIGVLKDGDWLTFLDYKGRLHPDLKAKISGADLIFENARYSMSRLASVLLKNEGHIADSVRGPDHWAIEDGKSIRVLWEALLQQQPA